jgi:hypothetical protein
MDLAFHLAVSPVSHKARQDPEHVDEALDRALEATFPASDPIALSMYCPHEGAARDAEGATPAQAGHPRARRRRGNRRPRAPS